MASTPASPCSPTQPPAPTSRAWPPTCSPRSWTPGPRSSCGGRRIRRPRPWPACSAAGGRRAASTSSVGAKGAWRRGPPWLVPCDPDHLPSSGSSQSTCGPPSPAARRARSSAPSAAPTAPSTASTGPPIPTPASRRSSAPHLTALGRGSLARMEMHIGVLEAVPARERPDLVAPPVAAALAAWAGPVPVDEIGVAEIDPGLADTAAFCQRYEVGLDESANCVVVAARRGGETRFAACVVLATTRADVNGLVRRHLEARRASFASLEAAVAETAMEYGGITPIGLPADWPILIAAAVAASPRVVVGSGLRRSKLTLPGKALGDLPRAEVLEGLGRRGPPAEPAWP